MARCRHCGAQIIYARDTGEGKLYAWDAQPSPDLGTHQIRTVQYEVGSEAVASPVSTARRRSDLYKMHVCEEVWRG